MNVIPRHICDIGKFDRDPEKSYTIPAQYYIDRDIFEREQEAIFFKSWNFVCHVSQVAEPNSFVTCMIGDQNIAVTRGADGVLRAFYNVCSHRAHELLTGCGKAQDDRLSLSCLDLSHGRAAAHRHGPETRPGFR